MIGQRCCLTLFFTIKKVKKKSIYLTIELLRASPGAAVKLCLGDLLVMGSNPETASSHMQG